MSIKLNRPAIQPRITVLLGSAILAVSSVALLTSTSVAKDKYKIDPVTGTKYKADPEMQELLTALAALNGRPIDTLTPLEARTQPTMADAVRVVALKNGVEPDPVKPSDVTAVEATIPASDGTQLTATIYTPVGTGPFPAIVYFHGGGWVIGSRRVYEAGARALAKGAEAVVVSVDYRLAPEHKFPAAWDDALATYKWTAEKIGSWRGDPLRLALAGESAGGNLAISTAIASAAAGVTRPKAVIAIYPVTQGGTTTESYVDSANAKPLNKAMMSWFFDKTLNSAADKTDPRLDLVHANLSLLPPVTIISAQIDPLRSDSSILEEALKQAHIPVEHKEFEGVTHEFFGAAAVLLPARKAQSFATDRLKEAFKP